MSVCPSLSLALPLTCTRVPKKMSPARWSRAVGMKCVMLCYPAESYTYHSLKLEDRPLWLALLCTAEAGDMVVLLWVSVVGDTRPGGVDDS